MSGSLDSLEHWSRQQPALPSSSVIFRHPRLLSGGHVAFPRRVQDFTPKPQKGSSHPLRVNHLSAAYNEADGTLVTCSAGEDWCSLRRCEKLSIRLAPKSQPIHPEHRKSVAGTSSFHPYGSPGVRTPDLSGSATIRSSPSP